MSSPKGDQIITPRQGAARGWPAVGRGCCADRSCTRPKVRSELICSQTPFRLQPAMARAPVTLLQHPRPLPLAGVSIERVPAKWRSSCPPAAPRRPSAVPAAHHGRGARASAYSTGHEPTAAVGIIPRDCRASACSTGRRGDGGPTIDTQLWRGRRAIYCGP